MSRPALIDKLCQAGKWLFKPELIPVDDVTVKRGSTAISVAIDALVRSGGGLAVDAKTGRLYVDPRPRRPDAGHCPRYGATGRWPRRRRHRKALCRLRVNAHGQVRVHAQKHQGADLDQLHEIFLCGSGNRIGYDC